MRRIIKAHLSGELRSTEGFQTALDGLNEVSTEVDNTVGKLLESVKQYDVKHHSLGLLSQTEPSAQGLQFDPAPAEIIQEAWTLRPNVSSNTACQAITTFGAWAAVLLHLMMHKCFCILYQPIFFAEGGATYQSVREDALLHARAYLQLFLRLCKFPKSAHYHWTYPRTYQPLHALSIILADLMTGANSTIQDQQASLLSRGLVDAVFELYETGEGIVTAGELCRRQLSPEGNHVWTMLLNARRTAFERMGQDPHVLIPSTTSSTSETCTCGKRIAAELTSINHQANPPDRSAQDAGLPEGADLDAADANLGTLRDEEQGEAEEDLNLDFDWEMWDAVFGNVPQSLQ
jgi:hypothetical protein